MKRPRRLARGVHRSIERALLDGPDFQQLSSAARHVLLTLKISAGPSGIEVEYEGSTESRLAEQTGIDLSVVREALIELSKMDWYRREAGVHWIVGHLQHEPSITATNENHRVSVHNHVAGLPHTDIVREFIHEHDQWFPANEAQDGGYAWAVKHAESGDSASPEPSHAPSHEDGIVHHRVPSTDDRIPNTDDRGADQQSAVEQLLRAVPNRAKWEAEIAAIRSRMPGHVVEQAASDYIANHDLTCERANISAFRGYLRRAQRAPNAATEPNSASMAGGNGDLADAQRLTEAIRALIDEHQVAGQGMKRTLRQHLVEEHFGPEVYAAFRNVGGAARFIDTRAEDLGFLHREFAVALRAESKAA